MRALLIFAVTAVGMAPAAAADGFLLLAGQYQCVQNCRGVGPAFITQDRRQLALVDENGRPSRGWIDEPGHIWATAWNVGATYSPDGFIIFDDGTAWQRVVPPAPLPLPPAPLPYVRGR
jgi:hypothetical protein